MYKICKQISDDPEKCIVLAEADNPVDVYAWISSILENAQCKLENLKVFKEVDANVTISTTMKEVTRYQG